MGAAFLAGEACLRGVVLWPAAGFFAAVRPDPLLAGSLFAVAVFFLVADVAFVEAALLRDAVCFEDDFLDVVLSAAFVARFRVVVF